MKKTLALLLATVMLLSMTACGGSAEPVETAPATTEAPTTAPTEEPAEEPTEAPTEAPTEPRVAPTVFEAVDPATLPEPIPVEEQLQSEGTQTVTLGSLEEYEDLLWSLGFEEVRLAGTHEAYANETGNKFIPADAYCEPVSLTYNNNAFRFEFTYCMTTRDGKTIKEDNWFMYGTKSTVMENISPMEDEKFYASNSASVPPSVTIIDGSKFSNPEDAVAAFQAGLIQGETTAIGFQNPNYEEDIKVFGLVEDDSKQFTTKTVYYPVTGNLYNYMRDPNSEGIEQAGYINYVGGETTYTTNVGMAARTMCFHYLFPAEDAAE